MSWFDEKENWARTYNVKEKYQPSKRKNGYESFYRNADNYGMRLKIVHVIFPT